MKKAPSGAFPLLAKAWTPISCANGHILMLTTSPVYAGHVMKPEQYLSISEAKTDGLQMFDQVCPQCGAKIFVGNILKYDDLGYSFYCQGILKGIER